MSESIEAWIAKKHPEWNVQSIKPWPSKDGRNQWRIELEGKRREFVVELREISPHKQEFINV